MKKGLSRGSGAGAHGIRQKAGGAGFVQLEEEQSVVVSNCRPAGGHREDGSRLVSGCWPSCIAKGQKARDVSCSKGFFSKQVKGNFFRMRAVSVNRSHSKVVEP